LGPKLTFEIQEPSPRDGHAENWGVGTESSKGNAGGAKEKREPPS